jgi:hypothetical protein
MPTIGPKNTQAAINRISADGRVTATEAKGLSKAVLKDLAQAKDLDKMVEALAKNLEGLRAKLDDDGATPKATSFDAEYNVSDLVGALEDAVEEFDEMGLSLDFMAAIGVAMADEKITVQEMKGIDTVVDNLLARSDDPGALSTKLRRAVGMIESQMTSDDNDIRDSMSKTAERGWRKMDLGLAKTVAKHIDTNADVTIGDDSMFAKHINDLDGWTIGMILPTLVDMELRTYDAAGLTGQAKLKMEQQQQNLGRAMMKHVEGLTNHDHADTLITQIYQMTMGEPFPPSQRDSIMDEMRSQDTDELHDAMADLGQQAAYFKSKRGTASKNKGVALGKFVDIIKAEIDRRGAAPVDPADPAQPAPSGAAVFALGVPLSSDMQDEIKGEWDQVTQSVEMIKHERANLQPGQTMPDPHWMEVYHDAMRGLFFGGDAEIIEDGGLKKPKAETPKEIFEVAFSMATLEEQGGHDALYDKLKSAVADHMGGRTDFKGEDAMFAAMSILNPGMNDDD